MLSSAGSNFSTSWIFLFQGPIECKKEYQTTCSTSKEEHQVEEDVPHCVVEEEEKCEEATTGYVTGERCMTWPVTKCKLVKKIVTKYTPNTKVQPKGYYE